MLPWSNAGYTPIVLPDWAALVVIAIALVCLVISWLSSRARIRESQRIRDMKRRIQEMVVKDPPK